MRDAKKTEIGAQTLNSHHSASDSHTSRTLVTLGLSYSPKFRIIFVDMYSGLWDDI